MSMDIYSKPGTKVVFTGTGGFENEREYANKMFKVGQTYTVRNIDVRSWVSYVEFEEFPGGRFNSVMFDHIRLE